MTTDRELNLPDIRNRAYAAIDGIIGIGYEIDCAWQPQCWLAFVPADNDNAANNADFLAHAHRDILALIAEVERLRGIA